jgi:hypothetical protein
MNKFVTSALALAATGSAAYAAPGDSEWLELDREIISLASSLASSQDGLGWTVLLRATATYSDDELLTGDDDVEVSGFKLDDADLAFWGAVGECTWRLSVDFGGLSQSSSSSEGTPTSSSSDVVLEDAYVRWACGEYLDVQFGQFKPRVSYTNSVDPENQLFIDRTVLGAVYDFWEPGVAANGHYEDFFRWQASLLNGSNGQESDHLYVLRGEFHYGTGAGDIEGAQGANDDINGGVGITYVHDDTLAGADTDVWVLDARGTFGQFALGFEIANLDDDVLLSTGGSDFSRFSGGQPLFLLGDSTPWSLTASFLLNSEFEFGVRYESLDNDEFDGGGDGPDNRIIAGVVNWFMSGNNCKWQLQVMDVDADNGFDDGLIYSAAFVVGATR